MKSFKKLQAKDTDLNMVQFNIEQFVKPLVDNVLLNHVLIKDVMLDVGDNVIDHKLGRQLQGYLVVKKSDNSNIYDKQTTNKTQTKTLVLNSSASVLISLIVF